MSFNIRFGTALDGANSWPFRRELLFKTIEKYDPDLLGLQEVLPFQRAQLIERLKSLDFVGVPRGDGKTTGEISGAMFRRERFEKVREGHFWLSPTPDVPGSKGWDAALPRIVTWVELRDRRSDNGRLFFFNTHWDHKGPEARLQSAILMRQRMKTIAADTPVIVTGDFNAPFHSEPYRRMTAPKSDDGAPRLFDSFIELHPKPTTQDFTPHPFTGKNDHPIRIDWILHTQEFQTAQAGIDHTNDNGRYPSDHFPVTATFGWRAAATQPAAK